MQEYTIIFIGKSGAGKGTQIKQLTEFLNNKNEESISLVETGKTLRDFINSDTYTSILSRENNSKGKLQPAFLAIWSWVNSMIINYTGQKVLCIDGAPRKLNEAHVLNEMLDFYNRENRFIVHLNVSDNWSKERLKERARNDDTNIESVESRLEWFNNNSKEIINYFEEQGTYKILTIHGEQSIEDVHKDIINALGL